MKLCILYHPEGEYARNVEQFGTDFERIYSVKPELISLETVKGSELAQAYDITVYPAIMVIADGGPLSKVWSGSELPLLGDVYSYYRS